MANKTYHQYCSIAYTLDLIGERWTLLIIRNLLAGPKRFSDLMKGLPGISTNILTDRLKTLEEQAMVTTRYLPPPAASSVYELTETGSSLVPVLVALARWGAPGLGTPQAEQHIIPEAVWFMVLGIFWRDRSLPQPLTCLVRVNDAHYKQQFGLQLSATGVTLAEPLAAEPDVDLELSLETLSRLSSHQLSLREGQKLGIVSIEGQQEVVEILLQWTDP